MVDKTVQIKGDTTHIDSQLSRLRGEVRQVKTEEDALAEKLRFAWFRFSHMANMFLRILGKSSEASIAMQTLQTVATALDIKRAYSNAAVAFGSHDYLMGAMLLAEAAEMGIIRMQMLQNIEQQRYQKAQQEQLANMQEAYQG